MMACASSHILTPPSSEIFATILKGAFACRYARPARRLIAQCALKSPAEAAGGREWRGRQLRQLSVQRSPAAFLGDFASTARGGLVTCGKEGWGPRTSVAISRRMHPHDRRPTRQNFFKNGEASRALLHEKDERNP